MRKQKGFMLMGMLIALGFAAIFFSMIAENLVIKQIRDQQAIPYKERLLNLKNQIENYQAAQFQTNPNIVNSTQLYPNNLKELETKGFLPKCSSTDISQGRCADINKTPWDSTIHYSVKSGSPPYAEIEIPLPNRNEDGRLYNVYTTVLAALPDIRFNTDETKLIWRINRVSDLPAFSLQLNEYIKRDGSTPLTKDWDVGNHAITNATDFSIRLQNGTQQRLGSGVIDYLVGWHGKPVDKHSCARDLIPDIVVTAKDLQAWSRDHRFSSSGAEKIGYIDRGNRWELYIHHNVLLLSTKKWGVINDGYLNVLRVCKRR
ncbi:type II secretion system protein (plasmid) [Photobacterium damselae subsp. damselae]|uniref:type II secretion system protein n=1 Tax=Photobacterium damselae TaxID=38293 RepID=UPI000A2FABCD|nr:type II secretion system protein [Photobacterium damselae]ARR51796.1 hypothetical protein CAY62_20485 [Photobacterium damselae subsp. damselae]QAY37481.1 type II secretion system protein [Photobacterium damselae subsp. damselae]